MSIILFILKLIGIILLALLGFVFVVLLIILFVPVRYQILGKIEEKGFVQIKVSWLMHLIIFCADYRENKWKSCWRILGIHKKPKEKRGRKKQRGEKAQDIEEDINKDEIQYAQTVAESKSIQQLKYVQVEDETLVTQNSAPEKNQQQEKMFGRMFQRMQMLFGAIKARTHSFFNVIQKIKTVIPRTGKKILALRNAVIDETNKIVFLAILAEVKYLLRHFKFHKLMAALRFSMGDPAVTGQTLGLFSMLPILYQHPVSLIPEFESEEVYIKGTFEIKGHIRLIHLVVSFVRLWKVKEVRIFIKQLLDG